MNAAKYIRYILTIATALLFFSACKDDKNRESTNRLYFTGRRVGIYQVTQLDKLYHNDQ